jgi:hypothetical protein
MRICLTRKLALFLDGIDVSKLNVGDEIDLPDRSASLLVAEGWAEPVDPHAPPDDSSPIRSALAEN